MSDRWAKVFDFAVLLFALIGAGQLAVWAFDRAVPVTVHWRSVVYESVRPGEEYRYVNDFTRTKFCEAEVQRWIVDSEKIRHDIETLSTGMPTEGLNRRQISMARIPVPKSAADGRVKSCFRSSWQCNPTQARWALGPIVGPETCLNFRIDSSAPRLSRMPIGRVTLG